MLNDHFRQALIECDVELVRKMWAHVSPHLPQPKGDAETLAEIHYARTGAESIPFKHRAYSHRWLTERSYPSGLPDPLRPRAERLYPRIVEAVGIAVKSLAGNKPLARAVGLAMKNAVKECNADGVKDPAIIRARMQEMKFRVLKG